MDKSHFNKRIKHLLLVSFSLSIILLLFWTVVVANETITSANLTGSAKHVDEVTAWPGATLQYTIVISNSGQNAALATLEDMLPNSLHYEPGSLNATQATSLGANNNVITWTGQITANDQVTITFNAILTGDLALHSFITNTAVISSAGTPISRTAVTQIVNPPVYLPVIVNPIPIPTFGATAYTCDSNEWAVSWSDEGDGVSYYTIQEAQNDTFTPATTYTTTMTSQTFTATASIDNVYYYRVRAEGPISAGDWSETLTVLGRFSDEFDTTESGWSETDNEIFTLAYADSNYVVSSKQTGFLISATSPDEARQNYTVEADVNWHTGSATNGLYGLLFGSDDALTRYYFFAVYPEIQQFRLFYFDSSLPAGQNLRSIVNFTSSSAINTGTAVNHLKVTYIGTNITLEVNGTELGSWSDNAITEASRSGILISSNPANPIAEARYDNFSVGYCNATVQTQETPAYTILPTDSFTAVELDW